MHWPRAGMASERLLGALIALGNVRFTSRRPRDAATELLVAAADLLKRDHGACPLTGGSNQTRPLICKAEYRSAEPAAGLHETRSPREQRGQRRRVDQNKERDMDMAGKMSGIDRHGASGHEDARNLRNATGAQLPSVQDRAL